MLQLTSHTLFVPPPLKKHNTLLYTYEKKNIYIYIFIDLNNTFLNKLGIEIMTI